MSGYKPGHVAKVNWLAGASNAPKGTARCCDCGPRPLAAFLFNKGSRSERCMACLQVRERKRRKAAAGR